MTILTFDFRQSYRGVTHTALQYVSFEPSIVVSGYNNQRFDIRAATFHDSDGTTTIYDGGIYRNATDPAISGDPVKVLQHVPAPDHFDLWNVLTDPDGLFLRFSAIIAPPPEWSDYVATDYYWNGDRNYGDDAAAWNLELNDWLLIPWFFSGGPGTGPIVPRTNARMADSGGELGTIVSDSPLDPNEFLNIFAYSTIVYGSNSDDILDGGNEIDIIEGGGGDDIIHGYRKVDLLDGEGDADWLFGDAGGDELQGGPGKDRLNGGRGSDTLTGEGGPDWFVFSNGPPFDTITDFKHGVDKIVLIKSIFTGLGPGAGVLNADAFHVGPHAADLEDRIIYWNHILFYDRDGIKNGDHGFDKQAFAEVEKGPPLTNTDFLAYTLLPL